MSGGVIREMLRFGTVGAGATLVHLIVAWVANRVGGIPPFAANACGFAAAFSASYLGHFYWTFGRQGGHGRYLPRFVIIDEMPEPGTARVLPPESGDGPA